MQVLVALPWRAQRHREYAHDITVQRYRELLPDADLVDVDTARETFCLAGCRNKAVKLAEEGGYQVAILADADTLPERGPLLEAITAATANNLVHLPYTEYWSLGDAGTRQFLAGVPMANCDHLLVPGACSGVYVTTPRTWWSHGGQDERMLGWGCEDAAFWSAHITLLGAEPVRHEGRVYAMHHEPQVKEGDQYTANFALVYRYHQAEGDPDAMRELIAERDGEPVG